MAHGENVEKEGPRDIKDEKEPDKFVREYLRLVCERGTSVRLTRTDDYQAICYTV